MLHFLLRRTGRHARNINMNKYQYKVKEKEKSNPKESQCHDGVSRRLVFSMFMHPGRFFFFFFCSIDFVFLVWYPG